MSKFSEIDVVKLIRDIPNEGLFAGDVGAVIHVFLHSVPTAYEVEFIRLDADGRQIVFPITEDDLVLVEKYS